ncbi:transcriptional regulator, TetR family [Citrifermentans bemidjiense Bem]|uniref:Transcriptional regulator, TetR family n=1 Tax=Citrifermentans bemidjiense (strain ATCC BAA-1014 / DSM 16622 / JCM 12645 / Bem) TaxID=404380 RepID=B5EG85_CITBB|nr:TetR/AcrR family transcriptional regulator [Citrifermentans bemidjiense]ACH40998.1 transcriptional regulator, TetR family [Citrifermentans bemidjiense Bem]
MTVVTTEIEPEPGARERLLFSALTLFNEKGYAAASVREIVEKAGVTKPVLYYYFGSKEGIYLELMETSYQILDSMAARAFSLAGFAQEKIIQFCGDLFDISIESLPMVRLINSIYFGPPQGTPKFDLDVFPARLTEVLQQLVSSGMRESELKEGSVEDVAGAVMAIVTSTINEQICCRENKPDRDTMVRMLRLLMTGIAPTQ